MGHAGCSIAAAALLRWRIDEGKSNAARCGSRAGGHGYRARPRAVSSIPHVDILASDQPVDDDVNSMAAVSRVIAPGVAGGFVLEGR